MGLEVASFIDDLVVTNPLGTDTIPQGDDHLRLIKTVLKATLKGASRAFYLPSTVASQTSTVTVAATDQGKLYPVDCSSGGITVDLPTGSGIPDGFEVTIIKTDHTTNLVTIDGASSETINGLTTQVLWQSYQSARLRYSTALSAWLMSRDYIAPKGEVTPWIGASVICQGGWLFLNGQTIGDASSSGTALAHASAEGLFKLLYAEFSDTVCPVSGGRGANAAADWSAHKRIGLPNLCGDTWVGLETMGGVSDAGRLTSAECGSDGQTNGEQIGLQSHQLTVAQTPQHSHPGSTVSISDPGHGHSLPYLLSSSAGTIAEAGATTVAKNVGTPGSSGQGVTNISATPTIAAQGGSGTHNNVQPSFVSGWKIKI